ncbi:MAG: hypothetical protein IPI60_14010 [Saprospiraceae bacterium]|nr:hypothetical protein [Saprospiraceae bacterium]
MKDIFSYFFALQLLTIILFCQCSSESETTVSPPELSNDSAMDQSYDQEIAFESMDTIGSIEELVRSTLDNSQTMQEVNSTKRNLDSSPVKYVEFRDSLGIRVRIDFIPESRNPIVQYTWIGNANEWLWLGKRINSITNHRDSFQECFYIKHNQPFAFKQQDLSVSNQDINEYFPVEALTWLTKIENE